MREMIPPIIVIILNTINIILLSICLLEIKWKNLILVNLIFFYIMISFNILGLVITVFMLFEKCRCDLEKTACGVLALYILIGDSIFFAELMCLLVNIDKVNYPCKKYESDNSSTSGGYYYVYYYYRRLTPEYDCDNLPEDFYTGIVTKKEETLGYTSISVALFFNIIISVFWGLLIRYSYVYEYVSCDCDCPSCSCSCCSCRCSDICCCFNKKIKEEKNDANVKVDNNNIKNTDANDIKMNADIEIHPTDPKSKEPIQEKIV